MVYKYLKNVVTLKVDRDKCTGCGMCTLVCPHQILSISDGKVSVSDRDRCIECGACAKNCHFNAIKVNSGVG